MRIQPRECKRGRQMYKVPHGRKREKAGYYCACCGAYESPDGESDEREETPENRAAAAPLRT